MAEISDGVDHFVDLECGVGLTPSSIVNWFTTAYRHLGSAGALVAFWAPDIHHPGSEAGAQGRRVVTGCSASRRSPVHSDNPKAYIDGDTDVQRRLVALI